MLKYSSFSLFKQKRMSYKSPLPTQRLSVTGQPMILDNVNVEVTSDDGVLITSIRGSYGTPGVTITPSNPALFAYGCVLTNETNGDLYNFDGTDFNVLTSASVEDHKVAVTGADTTPNYLGSKVAAGTGITIATLNPGANEQTQITNSGVTSSTVGLGLVNDVSTGAVTTLRAIVAQNDTGVGLVNGDLVYLTDWDAGPGCPKLAKAGADLVLATHVVKTPIANGDRGNVYEYVLSTADLNTNAGNVGDPVFLDVNGSTPTWTLTDPGSEGTAASLRVGVITVKDPAVGQIQFNVGDKDIRKLGTAQMQASLNTRILIAPISPLPAPTGADQNAISRKLFVLPGPSTIVSARLISAVATVGSDATNHYEFFLRNLTDGANLMSAAYSTATAELSADSFTTLTLDQNLTNVSDKLFGLYTNIKDDGGAGPTDLSTADIRLEIIYTPNV